jgi:nucleotide-binding universal stress UspA family protein
VAAITDGAPASLRAIDAGERIATGRGGTSVVVVRSTWRRLRAAITGGDHESARDEIERRSRELTGGAPVVLSGRPGRALDEWARKACPDLLVVAEDAPLGAALGRTARRLAAEGACSLLVARPVVTGRQAASR